MRAEKKLTVVWRVLQGLLLAVIALALLGGLYRIAAREIFGGKEPTVFGYSSAVVLTGSMSGTLEPDDLIVTHKQSEYSVGDVVTYQTGGTPVTHRIVAENEAGYRTKGDANNTDDGADIPKESIVGRVVLVIPKIGAITRFLRTPLGVLGLLAVVVLIAELPNLVRYIRGRNKKQEK